MRERGEKDADEESHVWFYCAAADARVRVNDRAHDAREDGDARAAVERAGGAEGGAGEVEEGARDAGRGTEADPAGRVAEKLLLGWTLTGETCPMVGCHTPLVRNRAGEMFCARHALYVRDARDAARAAEPPAGTAAARATANATARATANAAEVRAAVSESERRTLRALEVKAEEAREAFERETDATRAREWLALLEDAHAAMRRLGARRDD